MIVLYRPVGANEYKLIEQSGFIKFPPRLPEQPIFYPVLNEKYVVEIDSRWNISHNADHKGYVLKFEIKDEYISQYQIQTVGAAYYQEF